MSLKSHWKLIPFTGAVASYEAGGAETWGFTSHRIILNYRNGASPVQFSFDGTEDHGELGGSSGLIRTLEFTEFRTNKIYLKGGDATTVVELYVMPRAEV